MYARRARAVIGISAALPMLVALALGWLGLMVVSQEQVLERQRHRDRVEQVADRVTASVLRGLAETQAALAQGTFRPTALPLDPTAVPSLQLRLERTGLHTRPEQVLLYRPIVVAAGTFDESTFAEADRLEFSDKDDARLSMTLRKIARTGDQYARAEALLRLARLQARQRQTADALATYQELRDVDVVSPRLEVPYGLIARVEHCRMLRAAGPSDALTGELHDLRRQLRSSR